MISENTLNHIKSKYANLIENKYPINHSNPVIYLTYRINHILEDEPIFYVGSNYRNNPDYFGSSETLKKI